MSHPPASLYVHVPFCVRRCSYCDFAVHATAEAPVDDWLDAVEGEMRLLAIERGWTDPLRLDTLYIGGGTPSLLGGDGMRRLADRLRPFITWDPERVEWTCEANPESFTPEVAAGWRAAGVNRISLGAQTFHEPTLRWMGRMHGPEGPGRAMAIAREAGFDNVSLDLIFGLPERLGRDWSGDLDRIIDLAPDHVSLYGLTAEAATPLGRWVREGRESLAGEERYAHEYLLAHDRLAATGFEHYEVSNFGLSGRRSRHNIAYWTGVPYAALGPGAHAYHPPLRRWNLRGWQAYREAVAARRLPIDGYEEVSPADAALERVWLGLRTREGVDLRGAVEVQRDLAGLWAREGWAAIDGDRLRLSPEGWLLLDRLAVDFVAAGETAPGAISHDRTDDATTADRS